MTERKFIPFAFLIMLILFTHCDRSTEVSSPDPLIIKQEKKAYQSGPIFADNLFDGARMNDFIQWNDSTYEVKVLPENTPVNNSPWFAFRIWSNVDTVVQVNIRYAEDFKNRYLPKISMDGDQWSPLAPSQYQQDTSSGILRLRLSLSPEKLWIAAQELITTEDIAVWADSLAKRKDIKQEQIGQSVLGRKLNALIIDEAGADKSIVIIGRQHPPEVPGGTIALNAFLHTMLANTETANNFRKQFEILVIPLLNPDGVDLGHWRHNANGVDLNRDWVNFSQPETSVARDWLLNRRKNNPAQQFVFGIDFHTSYSGPYLLTLDTLPHQVVPRITKAWIDQIEQITGDTLDIRPRAQSLPYCYNWFINELGMEAVTYEEGDEIDRSQVKKRAEIYANTLMEILLE